MTEYRYVTADLLSDEELGEIPLADVSYGPALNGGGTLTGKIEPKLVPRRLIEPAQTVVYAYKNGRLQWGGIVWLLTPEGPKVTISAAGLESYPHRVIYTERVRHVYQDPIVIARELWTWMQDQPGADIGVEIGNETTGGKVKVGTPAEPWELAWWNATYLGQAIDSLARADDGFDYAVKITEREGTRTRRLVFGYPRLGKRTTFRFETGLNVVDIPASTVDGTFHANSIMVLGAGEGRNMRRFDVAAGRGRRPRLDRAVMLKDEQSNYRLERRGRTELAARANLNEVSRIVIRDHAAAPLAAMQPGDDVYARLHDGWTEFDGWVRIMGWQVMPGPDERIAVDVARSDLFRYGPAPDIETGGPT